MLLDAPDIERVGCGIGADHIDEEIAAQFPYELAVRCALAQARTHCAPRHIDVSRRIHAESANAPELCGRDLAWFATSDTAVVAKGARQFGLLEVAHFVEKHLLPRTRL